MTAIPIPEEERSRFSQKIGYFNEYWPTIESTIDKTFYVKLPLRNKQDLTMSGLGKQCADSFEEIRFVCTNGYGLAGSKLLRGLFERAVTAAYFAKNPDAATKFLNLADLDLGRLIHRLQDFLKANGEDPNSILPPELLQQVQDNYKTAKESEERCEKCGSPKGRVDVFSMAQNAYAELVPYYGPGFLEPTFHVHCTWYSVLEGVNLESGENHLDLNPVFEGERALRTLQLGHFVILRAMETQNNYFNLNLRDEINERCADYDRLWSRTFG